MANDVCDIDMLTGRIRSAICRAGAVLGLAAIVTGLTAGCGTREFADALDTNLTETGRIVSDTTLEPDEKREELAALGLTEALINALLLDERTANQFGGTLESALSKVRAGSFAALTPDEIQLYGDASNVTTYEDTEALSIAEFFEDNGFASANEIEEFLDGAGNEVPTGVDPENLRAVFVDFNPDDALEALP